MRSIILLALFVIAVTASSSIIDTYNLMFLDKYQRANLNNGQSAAIYLARTRAKVPSVEKEQFLVSKSSIDESRARRRHLLSTMKNGEELTDESWSTPSFKTIEEAIQTYCQPSSARLEFYNGKLDLIKSRLLEMKSLIEANRAEFKNNGHPGLSLILEHERNIRRYKALYSELMHIASKAVMTFHKFKAQRTFIVDHPELFVTKNLKTFPMKWVEPGLKPTMMAFIDAFDSSLPVNLQPSCTNYKEFVEENNLYIAPATSKSSENGAHVASLAVSLMPGSTFEILPNRRIGSTINYLPLSEWKLRKLPWEIQDHTFTAKHVAFLAENSAPLYSFGNKVFHFPSGSVPSLESSVVNVDLGSHDSLKSIRTNSGREEGCPIWSKMSIAHALVKYAVHDVKILVFPLGSESLDISSSPSSYTLIKSLCEECRTAFNILTVAALAEDELSLAEFTNQPGNGRVSERTICAPGVNLLFPDGVSRSGSSYAASFVTAAVSLLKAEFPHLANHTITSLLLNTATPIIIVEETFHGITRHRPVALINVAAGRLVPGIYEGHEGREVVMTANCIFKSRQKYGMGRLNLPAAIQAAGNIKFYSATAKL